MGPRLNDLLREFGVNPDQEPELIVTAKRPTSDSPGTGLPARFMKLLTRDSELRAIFEGRVTATPDRSPSGKDMVLGHRCRRFGFTPDEVRAILQGAPYPVDGGRTEDYLARTVKAIFTGMPKQSAARPRSTTEGFGMLPARLLDGTWADLSFKAAKLYGVMVIRRMRPSGIVRDGHSKLARWAGISLDSVGSAASELEARGLIHRRPRWHGVNYWVNDLTCTEKNPAHVKSTVAANGKTEAEGESTAAAAGTDNPSPEFSSEHVSPPPSALSPEHVVLVMSGDRPPNTAPSLQTRRDGSPQQEGGPGVVSAPGRCQALTKTRLECGLRAMEGGRFCRWHKPRKEVACASEA